MTLLAVIVARLVGSGAPLLVAVDDSVLTGSGRQVARADRQHDAATKTEGGKVGRS